MELCEIFQAISETTKKTKKEEILKQNDSQLLRKVLEYTYNPYKQYHVVKLPGFDIESTEKTLSVNHTNEWKRFLEVLDKLNERTITGNDAIKEVVSFLYSMPKELAFWMERVLHRHLNIGITSSTINKAFKNLVPTFKVQLAHVYEPKRFESMKYVAVEPKLDGVRCIAIVENGYTTLYSRNGKPLSDNYKATICDDLEKLAKKGYIPKNVVFDGELMGSDFTSTVSQIHRKSSVDVSNQFYHVFDMVPYVDWICQKPSLTLQEAREKLEDMRLDANSKFIRLVHRDIVPPSNIKKMHDVFVQQGYEGVMIKDLDSKYKFGRGHNVVKMKEFHDVDLEVVQFEEGTGKYEGMLGAIVVKFNNILVNVGSGFTDDERKEIWNHRSKFRNHIAEIRYQEETPDGSLRFPTFRGWRPDKK